MPELALLTESVERIATAAADTVEELGMGGLTHRAVAARANLTLGVVSYNFKTSADLARAAFEMLYRRVGAIASDSDRPRPVPTQKEAFDGMTGYDIMSPRLTAMDEVMITVARTPDLISFGPQLRYSRGRSSGVQLQGLVGPERPVSPADAALLSAFVSGQRHACVALAEAEVGPFRRRTLNDLLAVLGAALP
jgi:AcrR family transcriptional regulator